MLTRFYVVDSLSVCLHLGRADKKPQIGYFPIQTVLRFNVSLSKKFRKQRMIRCNECIWYSSPLKAEEFERTSIDTNLCNERPKLLRKLPSKIQFSHFPFAFLCCRHIISFGNWCEWNANERMHESSNGDEKQAKKSKCAPTIEWENARVLWGVEMSSVKKTSKRVNYVYELWTRRREKAATEKKMSLCRRESFDIWQHNNFQNYIS